MCSGCDLVLLDANAVAKLAALHIPVAQPIEIVRDLTVIFWGFVILIFYFG